MLASLAGEGSSRRINTKNLVQEVLQDIRKAPTKELKGGQGLIARGGKMIGKFLRAAPKIR